MKNILLVVMACLCVQWTFGQTIRPNTSIGISLTGVPQEESARFNTRFLVSESGMISLPFIGQIRAAGLTGSQLGSLLQSRYQQAGYYSSPTFNVLPDNITEQSAVLTVMVGGDVRKPGPVAYQPSLTLWGAIQAAGGESEFGSIKRVSLTRRGHRKEYNLTKAQFQNIPLLANDSVQVPRKNIWGN